MRLIPVSSSSDSSPEELSNGEKSRSMLYLNVYDLTPINNYLYWFGLGIFHSGIEGIFYTSCFHSIVEYLKIRHFLVQTQLSSEIYYELIFTFGD